MPYPHFLGQIKRFWGFLGPRDQNETDISVVFIDNPPEVNLHFQRCCKILTLPSAVTSGANRPNCFVGTCHFQYFMWVGMGGDGWMVIKGQRFSKSTFGAKNMFSA